MAVSAEPGLEVVPSLEGARELARLGNAIPLRVSFVDDCETPVSAFLKLRGDGPCRAPRPSPGARSLPGRQRLPRSLPAAPDRGSAAVRGWSGGVLRLRPRSHG